MREWNVRYRDDQRGGLPGSSAEREEGVVVDVVDHIGSGSRHRVYRREEGGENSKNIARKSITGQQAELDVF